MKPKKRSDCKAGCLDEWLDYYTDPKTRTIDISWSQFHWCEVIWVGRYSTTICHEDPWFRYYIPKFMENPNIYLNAHPNTKGLSMFGQGGSWCPSENMKDLASNTTLDYLDLGDNELYPEDIKPLATNNHIKELSLSYNYIGDGAAVFAGNNMIETLYVDHNSIASIGAQGIATMTALKKLDISDNPINDADGAKLVNELKNLKSINLEGTHIGDKTVQALFANKNLTDINVSCCKVGCITAWKLGRHAKANAEREKLSNSPSTLFHAKPKEKPAAVPVNSRPMTLRAS